MKCNCCGQPNKCLEISYLCHIEDIVNGGNLQERYVDNDGNMISGRLIVKNVCTKCYNRIMVETVKKMKSIRTDHVIDRFDDAENVSIGKYRFLSNFYKCDVPIRYMGMSGTTVEHLFQACKTNIVSERKAILEAKTPGEAKRLGGKCTKRKDWEDIKYNVMLDLVTFKFEDNKDIQFDLVKTGTAQLIEGNTWHDNTWGDCVCDKCKDIEGKNWLGKILMSVREKLIEKRSQYR
jgi:ribA/ribD-fused uncharacterized protein